MIIDKLENAQFYYGLGELIQKGFEYAKSTDLSKLESGDHEIIGTDLFVRIKRYDSFPVSQCKLETHKNYAEFHICLSGKEWFCYGDIDKMTCVESNEAKDVYYFEGETEALTLQGGHFIFVNPGEAHLPERAVDEISEPVVKAVVKIRVQ